MIKKFFNLYFLTTILAFSSNHQQTKISSALDELVKTVEYAKKITKGETIDKVYTDDIFQKWLPIGFMLRSSTTVTYQSLMSDGNSLFENCEKGIEKQCIDTFLKKLKEIF
ncbi:MAG: hypothetical protein HEEMFOPI_01294 [Holosporales bacterium]